MYLRLEILELLLPFKIMDLLPVEGSMGLYRDSSSNAILNCSDSDYEKYLEFKSQKMKDIEKIDVMNKKIDEIDQLKSDVGEMKEMMKLIIKKLDSNS